MLAALWGEGIYRTSRTFGKERCRFCKWGVTAMYPCLHLEVQRSTVPEGFPYFALYCTCVWLYTNGFPFWRILARQVFLQIGFQEGFTFFISFLKAGFSGKLIGSSASITKSTTASVILLCSSDESEHMRNGLVFIFFLFNFLNILCMHWGKMRL